MEEILASIRRIISEEGGAERDSKAEPAEPAQAADSDDDDILDLTEVIAGDGAGEPEAAGTTQPLAVADTADADRTGEAEQKSRAQAESEAEAGTDPAEAPLRFVVEPDTEPQLERTEEEEDEGAFDEAAETSPPAAAVAQPEPRPEPEPEPEPSPAAEPVSEPAPAPQAAAVAPADAMPDDGAPTAEEALDVPPQPAPAAAPSSGDLDMNQVIQRAAESAVAASGALATVTAPAGGLSAPGAEISLGFGVTEQHIEKAVREVLKPRLRDWLDKNLAALVERLVREEIQRLVEQSERPK
jgi:cell pole-organizing protein PopZ